MLGCSVYCFVDVVDVPPLMPAAELGDVGDNAGVSDFGELPFCSPMVDDLADAGLICDSGANQDGDSCRTAGGSSYGGIRTWFALGASGTRILQTSCFR